VTLGRRSSYSPDIHLADSSDYPNTDVDFSRSVIGGFPAQIEAPDRVLNRMDEIAALHWRQLAYEECFGLPLPRFAFGSLDR
jgi:hypothetical protein